MKIFKAFHGTPVSMTYQHVPMLQLWMLVNQTQVITGFYGSFPFEIIGTNFRKSSGHALFSTRLLCRLRLCLPDRKWHNKHFSYRFFGEILFSTMFLSFLEIQNFHSKTTNAMMVLFSAICCYIFYDIALVN